MNLPFPASSGPQATAQRRSPVHVSAGKSGHGRRAFTLIELLVSITILALVVVAVGMCVAGGIRAWDDVRQVAGRETDAAIAMERVMRDFRRQVPFSEPGFTGDGTSLKFSVTTELPWPSDDSKEPPAVGLQRTFPCWWPETVSLRWDANARTLVRSVGPAVPVAGETGASQEEIVLEPVAMASFEYGVKEKDGWVWQPAWRNASNYPAAIRLVWRPDAKAPERHHTFLCFGTGL